MYALSGRIDGNSIVVKEDIARYEGCDVVITILDRITDQNSGKAQKRVSMETSARELSGLWKTHNDTKSVEETVRTMRRGRQFDS